MRISLIFAGLLIAAPALAIPTPAGPFDLAIPGTTAVAEPVLAGKVESDKLVPFVLPSASAPGSGTVQVRTVRGADGKLAFYWKINNAASSKASIDAIHLSDFAKAPYDANWRKDGLGTVAPTSVAAGLSGDFKQWIYGFRFKTPIKPGESSRFFFLRSSAAASKPGKARLTGNGGASADFDILAPAG
jgi:hypothetical protein